ncbi:MAG: hypothetical protein LBE84_00695, partial [Planctomycetota bacterium]|nr:hypothetical protein [Planctomycetota bacterium]
MIPPICADLHERGLITGEQMKAVTLASQVGDFRRGIEPGDPDYKIAIILGFVKSGDVAVSIAKSLGLIS